MRNTSGPKIVTTSLEEPRREKAMKLGTSLTNNLICSRERIISFLQARAAVLLIGCFLRLFGLVPYPKKGGLEWELPLLWWTVSHGDIRGCGIFRGSDRVSNAMGFFHIAHLFCEVLPNEKLC